MDLIKSHVDKSNIQNHAKSNYTKTLINMLC